VNLLASNSGAQQGQPKSNDADTTFSLPVLHEAFGDKRDS